MSLVNTATGEILTRSLRDCEAAIESSFVTAGDALREIRDARLYLGEYADFDSYCRDRWDWNRQRAHQMIQAAEIVGSLSTIVDAPVPVNEAQARALSSVKDDPEAMRDAMVTATAEAEAAGAKLTAAHIKEAVKALTEPDPIEDAKAIHPSNTGPSPMSAAAERAREIAAVAKHIEKAGAFFQLYTPADMHELNDPQTATSLRYVMSVIAPWWDEYKATQPGLVVHQGGKQ